MKKKILIGLGVVAGILGGCVLYSIIDEKRMNADMDAWLKEHEEDDDDFEDEEIAEDF